MCYLTGSSLTNNGNINPNCVGLHSLTEGEVKHISCSPPLLGRYVNIRIPGN